MVDDTAPLPEDDVVLAAEYVLHLLAPEERAAAEARMRRDPAFSDEVRRWQEDLAPLALGAGEVRPSPAAKDRLMARLFEERHGRASASGRGFFDRWRWGLATALAAVVLVAALLFYPVTEPGPSYATELQPEAREFVLTAALSLGETAQLELTRVNGPAAPAGRATELWAIPPDGAPISLGVLPAAENWTVTLPPELAQLGSQLTLALSDEPEGGSTTGAPTGDVLAASSLSEL